MPTLPLPLPLAPETTLIHATDEAAVHAQSRAVLTSNVLAPPDGSILAPRGSSVAEQLCPWLTVNVRPPIVSVPLRAGPSVAPTLKLTVPLPEPLAPSVTVIQSAWLVA